MIVAPAEITALGPKRSSNIPMKGAAVVQATDPKMSVPETRLRLQRNSSATGNRKTAKAARLPKAAPTVMNAIPRTSQG
jgi:hypothetical protein